MVELGGAEAEAYQAQVGEGPRQSCFRERCFAQRAVSRESSSTSLVARPSVFSSPQKGSGRIEEEKLTKISTQYFFWICA